MNFDLWIIVYAAMIFYGVMCIGWPNKAYNFGRPNKEDAPDSWVRKSKIVGIALIVVGLVFVYFDQIR
ncbi:MAG: hypothetical protein LBN22_08390 [Clostridiales Family XIII bacterium]|jgi:hypothetical protein|nr:hypothetical protein [Clostridiales Family XIII bacterium]